MPSFCSPRSTLLAILICAGSAAPIRAAQPPAPSDPAAIPAQPAATATPDKATTITIRAVVGKVACRAPGKEERTQAKVGDVLSEGTEITTGLRSQVQFQVGTGQVFTLDRVGRVIVKEAIANLSTDGKEKTTVDLPYGRVKFEITSATVSNDVQIQAPDATLAVKGTMGLMDVTPGFPTLSYGAPGNNGVFAVRYLPGSTVSVAHEEQTDKAKQDPAVHELGEQYVEVIDTFARTGDEFGFVYDFASVFQLAFDGLTAPGIATIPPATGLFGIDEDTGQLIQYDINDPAHSILLAATSNAGSADFVGATTRPSSLPGGGTQYLRLLSSQGKGSFESDILGLDLGRGQTAFSQLAHFSTSDRLEGLGTLSNEVYSASGDSIVRLNLVNSTMTQVGDFGMTLEGGVSAYTSRGTLLIPGRLSLPGLAGAGQIAGLFGPGAAILEFDPRTNYLRSAFSDLTSDFQPDKFDTVIDSRVDPAFNTVVGQQFAGTGRFSIVLGGGIGLSQDAFAFLVNYTADVNGTPTSITALYNAGATRQVGDPALLLVGPTGRNIRDFSGETPAASGASVTLSPPPANIDTSLPRLFRELAYSQQALNSGVVRVLAERQVLATARNPTGCIQSGALSSLPTNLAGHVNQSSGIGGAIYDFRSGLAPTHPCRPPLP